MTDNNRKEISNSHRWVVFFIISLVYFFVYFHRVSTSVIAPDILTAFNTTATALGFMSSMYFYLYAFEQPLVGHFTDRLGARRVIAYSTLVAAAGCFLFALAPNIWWASVGRALIGIGVGGVYVPAIKAFSQWFKSNQFATILGLLVACGNCGAIIATTPLAWAAANLGWRISFNAIGFISLLLALAVLFLIKDFRETNESVPQIRDPQPAADPVKAPFYQPFFSSQFWIIGMTFSGVFGIVMTFQGLWATPFLMAVFGIDRIAASKLNMLIPIGFVIGSPLFGWLSDKVFRSKIRMMNFLLVMLTCTWVGIVFGMNLGVLPLSLILFFMGMGIGGFISIVWAYVKDITPPQTLGSFSGLLNLLPFLGVAVFQVLTGLLLDKAALVNGAYLPASYKGPFLLCLLVCGSCLLLSFFIRGKKETN
ncbi:MAG TPA: MFS transporter [Smithellaceae bacterium]|nr:MFS transporter [Smithellaceae bacterium]